MEPPASIDLPTMGVAIVSFHSADIIADCLDSLAASHGVRLKIVLCDNASGDASLAAVRNWAAAQPAGFTYEEADCGALTMPRADLTVLRSALNGGFAHGTNRCIEVLLNDPAIDLFWLVNPDARVHPDAALHYARTGADGQFALMGGRTLFAERPDIVQTDGGRVSPRTGLCISVNWGMQVSEARVPPAASLDYITGANCVAARAFIAQTGLMREDYFLYYEEVDWALRRGPLELRVVPEAVVYHLSGTAIGSAGVGRRPTPFANYFTYRNRARFLRRFYPGHLLTGMGYAVLKAGQLLLRRAPDEAWAVIAGMFGFGPPAKVRARIAPEARAMAFGKVEL